MAHRHVDGALPAGRAIADQFRRHERWGRLAKQHGTGRAADTRHLAAWRPPAEEAGRHPSLMVSRAKERLYRPFSWQHGHDSLGTYDSLPVRPRHPEPKRCFTG
jgi:hypothetical protein